ncbi:MAG: nucleotidyl transferase AbiEii/AbiGii toxin family protein [Endomicrobia bacterium]|nr:nucleotidyl transferase AbiEii/AbiGii toxin family protein [Endomicrobiia bacterium]MCL2800120.1 nucleotidyl transferase AbiEii/AbiGii toxin family protein [Endomicrobiia bacterium]
MLNSDYKELLSIFNEEKVKFILVGAYAMAVHGYPRATMDIDVWVIGELKNSEAIIKALRRFGAPLDDISSEDFQKDNVIFQIGVFPRRIDIVTSVDGLEFDEAYRRSVTVEIEDIKLKVLSKEDLIKNKLASGRTKDLADVETLQGK